MAALCSEAPSLTPPRGENEGDAEKRCNKKYREEIKDGRERRQDFKEGAAVANRAENDVCGPWVQRLSRHLHSMAERRWTGPTSSLGFLRTRVPGE